MRNKPKCILVDDEDGSLSALKGQIELIGLLEIEKAFLDPDKFLTEISEMESEIIFLDMAMTINGIEVAQKLKGKKVIFVSGHKEDAHKAFDVDAVDFVPKPIQTSRLKQAIEKVLNEISIRIIVLRTQDASKEELNVESIVLITTNSKEKRDKDIHLGNGTVVRAKQYDLKDLEKELPKNKFMKINSSEIVNLDFVKKLLSKDSVGISINGKIRECTLGETCKEAFFSHKPHFRQ